MTPKNDIEEQLLPLAALIPSAANYALPDDSLLMFYNDLEERSFWLNDEVNSYSLNLAHYIVQWNREDKDVPVELRKPIKLLIHSPGGNLDILKVLSNIISLSKTPIIGYNLGNAYSAAAMILLSCHKRYGFKDSNVLFHKGSCQGVSGSYEEIQTFMEEYKKQVDTLSKIIVERTQFSEEEVKQKMQGDWYVSSKECIEKNVYNGIITSIDEIL